MGAGTFVFDSDHVFGNDEVYRRLWRLDEQRTLLYVCQHCEHELEESWPTARFTPCPACGKRRWVWKERLGLLSRLGNYLRKWTPLTMIIEEDVLDEEYFREFLFFYGTTFLENPPTTKRYHFFAAN